MNLINKGDFLESYTKVKLRGINYFLRKFNFNPKIRTQSTFDQVGTTGSNWWIISDVKQRQNEKISGDPSKTFDVYLAEKYFQRKSNLKLLSVGCGEGSREIRMAESGIFNEVFGLDLSVESIKEASRIAKERNLHVVKFEQADFNNFEIKPDYFDVVLFYASLHHFKNIVKLVPRIKNTLKKDGYLVLYEYVGMNRLQFDTSRINSMNRLLNIIPEKYRNRYLTNTTKNTVYAPGLLRMIISDPSEAVESETIRPIIHENFKVIEEKDTGGDLLMMVLKDIAHNFNDGDRDGKKILGRLFHEEDQYMKSQKQLDFIFGIYQKKES